MTTFLDSEKEAKVFAVRIIKALKVETLEQKPTRQKIDQFGFVQEGDAYSTKIDGKDVDIVFCETQRGWNVWLCCDGMCRRL